MSPILTKQNKKIFLNTAYRRNWDKKIAKKIDNRTESILTHHLKTTNILEQLFELIHENINLTQEDLRLTLLAAFIHDVGKEKEEWQKKIKTGSKKFVPHVGENLTEKIVTSLIKDLEWDISEGQVIDLYNTVMQHMEGSRRNTGETLESITKRKDKEGRTKWVTLTHLLAFADRLASTTDPSDCEKILTGTGMEQLGEFVELTHHKVNQIRGLSTMLIHLSMEEVMQTNDWKPVLYFSNGTVYLRSKNNNKKINWTNLEKALEDNFNNYLEKYKENEASALVGNPTASIINLPRLFSWENLEAYFRTAKNLTGIKSINDVKDKNIKKYLLTQQIKEELGIKEAISYLTSRNKKEILSKIDEEEIDEESKIYQKTKAEFAEINPEAILFKFFKGIFNDKIIAPNELRKLVKEKYDTIFGEGAFENLQSMSTLKPVQDRLTAIDNYWSLPAKKFGIDKNMKIKELPAEERQNILEQTLLKITKEVSEESSIKKERAYLQILKDIAKIDIIYPKKDIAQNLTEYCDNYLENWVESKHSQKSKRYDAYVCPRCNHLYTEENYVAAEISGFKKKFSNRVIGGTRMGDGLSICVQCELELLLRYLPLKGRTSEIIVLYPEISVQRNTGANIQQQINQLEKGIENLNPLNMEENFNDFTFRRIDSAAKQLIQNEHLLEKLNQTKQVDEFLELFTFQRNKERFISQLNNTLEEILETLGIDMDDKTEIQSMKEGIEFILKTVKEKGEELKKSIIRSYFSEKIRSPPGKEVQFFYQTPNFFIWLPEQSIVAEENDSEVNSALKKVFISLLISIFTGYSVAILDPDEYIPPVPQGKVYIPPNSHIRSMFKQKGWLETDKVYQSCLKIAGGILIAKRADYPERSNLYAALTEDNKGKLLRRIEVKNNYVNQDDIKNLEFVYGSEF